MYELSAEYTTIYDNLLEAVGTSPHVTPSTLTAFWPMCGHQYDGGLMVIGRVTNGWHKAWEKEEVVSTNRRLQILKRTRGYSESKQRCPMLWVTDRAGDIEYNTNQSAFWRIIKRISLEGNRDWRRAEMWPSWVCWSNLFKVGPSSMQEKPKAKLKQVQFPSGVRLIAQEIQEFNPSKVLILTGRDWFSPFAQGLGLAIKWRTGFVEGMATQGNRQWVVANHPMGKPEDVLVDELLETFAGRLVF